YHTIVPMRPLARRRWRREGGALSCAPSTDAVAGNGCPLSLVSGGSGIGRPKPTAHAVAGSAATFTLAIRGDRACCPPETPPRPAPIPPDTRGLCPACSHAADGWPGLVHSPWRPTAGHGSGAVHAACAGLRRLCRGRGPGPGRGDRRRALPPRYPGLRV